MKKLAFLFFLLTGISNGQLIRVTPSGLSLITDSISNNMIIPFEFELCEGTFENNLERDGQEWLAKNSGRYFKPILQFDSLLILKKGDKWGCYTTRGRKKIDFTYYNKFYFFKNATCIGTFYYDDPTYHKDYFAFQEGKTVFRINDANDSLVAVFGYLREKSGNSFLCQAIDSNFYGLISPQLDTIFEFSYRCTSWDDKNFGFTDKGFLALKNKAQKCGVIDATGKIILPFEYDYIDDPCFKTNNIEKGDLKGLIDDKVNFIFPIEYDDIKTHYDFYDKICCATLKNGFWTIYDTLLQKYCQNKFDLIDNIFNEKGISIVKENGKFGIFNLNEKKYLIDAKSDHIGKFEANNGINYFVKENNVYNLFNNEFKPMANIKADTLIGLPSKELLIGKKAKKYFLIDFSGKIISGEFDSIIPLPDLNNPEFLVIKDQNKFGCLGKNGSILVPTKFENYCYPNYEPVSYIYSIKLLLKNKIYYFDTSGDNHKKSSLKKGKEICDE